MHQSDELINFAKEEHLNLIHRARLSMVSSLLPRGEIILDLGGANCPLHKMGYPHKFKKLFLIDLPPDSRCDMYKDVVVDSSSDGGEVVIRFGDMTQLDAFSDESIDFVWSGQSIEHVPLDGGQRMCNSAYRVLKPGGIFCLDTPNRLVTRIHTRDVGGGYIHPEHCLEYEPEQLLQQLHTAGFFVQQTLGICEMPLSVQSGTFNYMDFIYGKPFSSKVNDCYIQFFYCIKH